MNLGQGKVPKGEPESAREPPLDALDLAESLPGVRALVVAVFDEERSILRAAYVVDRRGRLPGGLRSSRSFECAHAPEKADTGRASGQWRWVTHW